MSERQDYDRLAGQLADQADRMEQKSERLGGEIGEVRQDWDRKRRDDNVPGAQPFPQDADRDAPGDNVNPWDAGRNEHEAPESEARADRGPKDEDLPGHGAGADEKPAPAPDTTFGADLAPGNDEDDI